MDCAFIGFGNAAYDIARGLRKDGVEHIFFYKHRDVPPFSGLLGQRVSETGAVYKAGYAELMAATKTVISCVVGSAALQVAREAAAHLTAEHLYVDANTASPAVKQQIAALVKPTGALFVDAAIMGPVEALWHKVPIMACGEGARQFHDLMTPHGMDITVLQGEPGRAAAVKLLRSVFQKGMMCLLIEMLTAARACDVEDIVMTSVGKTFDGVSLQTMAGRMVPKAVYSADRMAHEMEEVKNALDSMGLPSFMAGASALCLGWCKDMNVDRTTPMDLEQTLCALQVARDDEM